MHGSPDQEVELLVFVGDVGGAEPLRQGRPGVVDDQVDRAGRVRDAVDGELKPVLGGQVGADDVDVDAVLGAEVGGHRLKAFDVPGHQREVPPAAGELAREG